MICAGPLLAFVRPLREAQDDAELTLWCAGHVGGQRFEERWLPQARTIGPDALGGYRISRRPTDLFSVVGQRRRTCVPSRIEIKDFVPLLVATVLPFLPIILRQVSFADLLTVAQAHAHVGSAEQG